MPADNYAWDPDYMGSSMMVPVLYVTWFMAVVFISLMGEQPSPCNFLQLSRWHCICVWLGWCAQVKV